MDPAEEARANIWKEITSDDPEVRGAYLARYTKQAERFAAGMAAAFLAWRGLDANSEKNDHHAYVSAMAYTAITLHIQSMRLFLSGHTIAAGNLSRQALEAIALALLFALKEQNVLQRFMEDKYSSNDAIRDVAKHYKEAGLQEGGAQILEQQRNFYHQFSHPTKMTIATVTSFTAQAPYVGASFDEEKVGAYDAEVEGRVNLAEVFSDFVGAVTANVRKW
jgi:hypothetical protein